MYIFEYEINYYEKDSYSYQDDTGIGFAQDMNDLMSKLNSYYGSDIQDIHIKSMCFLDDGYEIMPVSDYFEIPWEEISYEFTRMTKMAKDCERKDKENI